MLPDLFSVLLGLLKVEVIVTCVHWNSEDMSKSVHRMCISRQSGAKHHPAAALPSQRLQANASESVGCNGFIRYISAKETAMNAHGVAPSPHWAYDVAACAELRGLPGKLVKGFGQSHDQMISCS